MSTSHYLTPESARALAEELRRLVERERPRVVQEVADAAAQGDRSENAEYIYGKKRLREIDRRVRWLTQRLDSAEVVRQEEVGGDRVRFGATVEVEDEDGRSLRYRIVGSDESDPARGLVSYQSPLGRALLQRRVGDTVVVQRPAGELVLTVRALSWAG